MIDVIVIGAGPAGVLAALPAADLGAQTALVTRDEFGGMAANDGAVPVRTLAHAARLIRKARRLGRYGVAVSEPVTQVPTAGAAFYPSTAAVLAKLGSQTPRWKWPLWRWMTRLRAWPSAPEALASAFDFNRAPFFQSFVEVRVEGSASSTGMISRSTAKLFRRDRMTERSWNSDSR
jgi:glycine/D-amino acid oxidase-like deaminating enzyme